MVVAFYSSLKVPENHFLVSECANKLHSYSPTPKWKLVIEIGNPIPKSPAIQAHPSMAEMSDKEEPVVVAEIVTLLGNELLAASKANPSPQDLSPEMMGMRLLLLKSASSRTAKEKDLVGILEGSYKAYAKDNKRSRSELARLLVTEYMCLTSTTTPTMNPTPAEASSMPGSPPTLSQSAPQLAPNDDSPPAVPRKVYSSTQLGATLPPMMFRLGGMSRPPNRLPSLSSSNNMRRTVSLSGIASGGSSNFVDPAFHQEQPPSF